MKAFLFSWGLKSMPLFLHSADTKGKTVSGNRGQAFEKCVRAISSRANFCQTSCGLARMGFANRIWSPRNPAPISDATLRRRETRSPVSRWERLLIGWKNQGLGTESQTHPCWYHHYWFKPHEEYQGAAKGRSWVLHRFEPTLNAREEKQKVLSLQKCLKVLL